MICPILFLTISFLLLTTLTLKVSLFFPLPSLFPLSFLYLSSPLIFLPLLYSLFLSYIFLLFLPYSLFLSPIPPFLPFLSIPFPLISLPLFPLSFLSSLFLPFPFLFFPHIFLPLLNSLFLLFYLPIQYSSRLMKKVPSFLLQEYPF